LNTKNCNLQENFCGSELVPVELNTGSVLQTDILNVQLALLLVLPRSARVRIRLFYSMEWDLTREFTMDIARCMAIKQNSHTV